MAIAVTVMDLNKGNQPGFLRISFNFPTILSFISASEIGFGFSGFSKSSVSRIFSSFSWNKKTVNTFHNSRNKCCY